MALRILTDSNLRQAYNDVTGAIHLVDAAGNDVGAISAGEVNIKDADVAEIVEAAGGGLTDTQLRATPVPVSAAGAATAAKQPALGTAGNASADVISIQGVASMTAVKVDGSGVTQPVSASALPLPTGAATAAKQPALGTAGSASADVISVQGIPGGTTLPVTEGSAAEIAAAVAALAAAQRPTSETPSTALTAVVGHTREPVPANARYADLCVTGDDVYVNFTTSDAPPAQVGRRILVNSQVRLPVPSNATHLDYIRVTNNATINLAWAICA